MCGGGPELLTAPAPLSPRAAIAAGWADVSKDISEAVVATALAAFFATLLAFLLQQILPALFVPLVQVDAALFETGLVFYFLRRAEGKAQYVDIFAGFSRFLRPAAFASVSLAFASFGWLAAMMGGWVPGLAATVISLGLQVAYLYTFLIIAGGEAAWWWSALEKSRRLTLPRWKNYLVVVLALIGLNLGGLLCAVVGVLVTIPVSICAVIALYRQETGPPAPSA